MQQKPLQEMQAPTIPPHRPRRLQHPTAPTPAVSVVLQLMESGQVWRWRSVEATKRYELGVQIRTMSCNKIYSI
jgi:hypothetical protein